MCQDQEIHSVSQGKDKWERESREVGTDSAESELSRCEETIHQRKLPINREIFHQKVQQQANSQEEEGG